MPDAGQLQIGSTDMEENKTVERQFNWREKERDNSPRISQGGAKKRKSYPAKSLVNTYGR